MSLFTTVLHEILILFIVSSFISFLTTNAEESMVHCSRNQTPGSFARGLVITDLGDVIPTIPSVVHQARCRDRKAAMCPGSFHCCQHGDVCCPHGCCPKTFRLCDGLRALCLNKQNLTKCTDRKRNVTFVGTPCARGGCCGFDSRFPYCPLSGPHSCVNAEGYFPCLINSVPLPGVLCDVGTCCPNPLRCCGHRCCSRGASGPVPIETVGFNITMGFEPANSFPSFSPAPEMSPSMAAAYPSFVLVWPSPIEMSPVHRLPPANSSGLPLPISYPLFDALSPFTFNHTATPSLSSSSSLNSKPDPMTKPACFPGSARVFLKDTGLVDMESLHVDDIVLANPTEYSRIFMWTHGRTARNRLSPEQSHIFIRVTVSTGSTLTASVGHIVYVCFSVNGKNVERRAVIMAEVNISHSLCGIHEHEIVPLRVSKIDRVLGRGLYNPHTLNGDIVVDGFLCSCYTSALSGQAAHSLLTPLRALRRLSALVFQS